jgi:hypothetical protein
MCIICVSCMRICSVCFCQINGNFKLISEKKISNLFVNAMVRFTSSGGPNKCIIKHPMDVRFQIKWMFVSGRQWDVRFRTSNGSPVWTFYGEDIRTFYNH